SSLRMDRAIGNVMQSAGVSLMEAVTMASTNPARVGRVPGRRRGLTPGEKSDVVLFRIVDDRIEVGETWLGGKLGYPRWGLLCAKQHSRVDANRTQHWRQRREDCRRKNRHGGQHEDREVRPFNVVQKRGEISLRSDT